MAQSIFPGDGEMARVMRELDWSQTPLGPVNTWSPALRMMARFLLANRFPLLLWWGPHFCQLYNDAYRPILGKKHPQFVGRPVSECWDEIWHILEPLIQTPFSGGPSTWIEEFPLEINRHGFLEETHFTVAYSPVPDETVAGGIGGVLATVHEISEKVVGERRTVALRDLGASILEERSAEEACARAAGVLARYPKDVSFALLYLLDPDRKLARLAGSAGLDEKDHDIAPTVIDVSAKEPAWPLSSIMDTGQMKLVEGLGGRFASVPPGPWSDPPHSAAVLPIRSNVARQLAGFLIAGISPRLRFDELYLSFLELAASHLATAVTNARAYEEERKRAEALAELDRAKTLFFSNVSHEFRTPLTLMLGPLEELAAKGASRLGEAEHQQVDVARRNALRLLKLVNTLLDFSRIEAGRVQAVYEPTDICRLTEDISSAFRSSIERAGLRFTIACEAIDEPVYVDREMWEKIVLNLLSNAFKFTFQGEVAVTLKLAGNAVELAVRDTGVGISEAEQSRVFERFHRIENTRARTYEGTGIGLALVQELSRLHGGGVRLESSPGRGSTFTVSIPRGKAHLPADRIGAKRASISTALAADAYVDEAERWLPEVPQTATEQPLSSKLPLTPASPVLTARQSDVIVIADDNADMRDYLVHLLGGEYRVHAVADGLQAVQATRELHPSLVLADVMMPGLDGFGVLNAIRSDASMNSTPVVLLSARAGEESRVEGIQAGADDYLVKPFTARELIARVSTHIKMAKLRSEAAQREARLRAEAERERHRFQELLAQAPAAIGLLAGPEHRWIYVNEQYIRVTGRRAASDFVGKTIRESLPEIETQIFIDLLDEVYHTGKPYVGSEVAARLNRSHTGQSPEAYFDCIYQPVTNEDGSVEGILIHAVEVTDKVMARKVAEERERALRESEQRFRVITDATPVLVWMSGTDKLCTYFNRSWLDFVGRTLEHELGNGWAENVHPDDFERCLRIYVSSFEARQPFEMEYRLRHHSGQYRWILDRGVPRFTPDGTFEGYIGGCLDIHEQKEAAEKLRIAAEELRESEERYRTVAETASDAIVSIDENSTVLFANSATADVFGYAPEELIGKDLTMLMPDYMRRVHEAGLRRYVETGQRHLNWEATELPGLHKDGREIPLEVSFGEYAKAGKHYFTGFARDISDRKRAEEALRQSEMEFRGLANSMPTLAWMANPDGWIFWYNQRWYEYTRTTPEQMEGWGWQSVHDPEVLPTVMERWKQSIASGEPFEMTFPLRGADGHFRPFLTRVTPIRDEHGNLKRWFGTNTDVSSEVAVQKKLQTALFAAQKLAAIVESSDDAILSKDLQGVVTAWNPAAERLFGYSAQEMIGRSIMAIVPPELQQDEDTILATIGRGEKVDHFETVRLTKSGERIHVSVTVSPIRDEAGNVIGAANVSRDITEHKKAERALRMSERLASVGRLAATVAHEINNPLEAVTNLVYLAKDRAVRDDVREFLAHAEEELGRVSHLTKQVLGFYRETKSASAVRVGALLTPLVAVFAPRSRNKGVEICPEILDDPEIYAIPGEIRQLLANLLSNSIDAVRNGGRIRVRISGAYTENGQRASGVRITVADSGSGIPAAVRERIFEPFFTTKKEVGTGLGLWVCKSIVDKHHGTIRVKSSTAPGHSWTVFSVFLPSLEEHDVQQELRYAV